MHLYPNINFNGNDVERIQRMTISLQLLSVNDSDDVYEMLQRIGANEYDFYNAVHGMSKEDYHKWLNLQNDWAQGRNLPKHYVKQWTYWLMKDGRPIGYGKLRERATEESRKSGGNIGYAIDPIWRGHGFGFILFSLLLKKAAELNIREIYSTVVKPNIASKIVHLKANMRLYMEDDKKWYFYFKL